VLQDGDGTPITIGNYDFTSRSSAYSQEFVLQGGPPRLKWVVGGTGGVENARELELITNVPLVATTTNPLQFSGKMRNANLGLFGQANWEFIPKVRFTVGARYSWDNRRLTADNRQAGVCVVPAAGSVVTNLPSSPLNGPSQCPRTFQKGYGQPSWETVLDYQATDDLYGYAKISYGYRAGGIGLRGGVFQDTFTPFLPETVTNYEAGAKLQFFDRRARLNVAAFYDSYSNIQVTTAFVGPTGANIGITTNATEARVYGFEGDLALRPTPELTITSSVGLTNAKYTHFVDVTGDRSNTSFGLPEVTANIGANYLFKTSFGSITPSVDYAYRSSLLLTPIPTTVPQYTQPAFGLLNGRVSFQVDSWGLEIAAFGRNLTDEVYTVSSLGTGGVSTRIYGTRRTYGLTVTKRFGG
jgi:iron complex outermembrane receptor protein